MWLQYWINVLVGWLPFILLIGFWIWFMKMGLPRAHRQHLVRVQEHMVRMEDIASRIAVSLERIAAKNPGA